MITPTSSDILDKIRKLLRLADISRGATEHEAKVALAKAHELMTRHNIDAAVLRMDSEGKATTTFNVSKSNFDLPKVLNPADLLILSLLQRYVNVRVILMPNSKQTPVDIIGKAVDVEYAIYVFHFLRQTFFRCWNEFKRTVSNPDKKSFYRGVHDGLKEALESAKQHAESAYSQEQRGRYEIVLVNEKAIVERYVAENYGKLRSPANGIAELIPPATSLEKSRARRSALTAPLQTLNPTIMNPENTNRSNIQRFGTTTVQIMKSLKGGARFAEIRRKGERPVLIPVEILALAAGKDAWMRKIQVRCAGCGVSHAAEDLSQGGYCQTCMDAIDEENEQLNRGSHE